MRKIVKNQRIEQVYRRLLDMKLISYRLIEICGLHKTVSGLFEIRFTAFKKNQKILKFSKNCHFGQKCPKWPKSRKMQKIENFHFSLKWLKMSQNSRN